MVRAAARDEGPASVPIGWFHQLVERLGILARVARFLDQVEVKAAV
jgi:hypothetical protein